MKGVIARSNGKIPTHAKAGAVEFREENAHSSSATARSEEFIKGYEGANLNHNQDDERSYFPLCVEGLVLNFPVAEGQGYPAPTSVA